MANLILTPVGFTGSKPISSMSAIVDRQVYLTNTFNLVGSINIVFKINNDKQNYWLRKQGYVIDDDPSTHRYYKHLMGIYHDTDTKMSVYSLDTHEIIEFNQANLGIHLATKETYRYNTRLYLALVSRYPDQETLIKGILYPSHVLPWEVNDGTIVSYDQSLVEVNEYRLITDLQYWVYQVVSRWNVGAYNVTEDLYAASFQGMLFLNLVPTILNLRTKRIKSNETHSYHVRQYFTSNGLLREYYDFLTLKQQLWLYRNLKYLRKHRGKEDTFNTLIKNILENRGIPLIDKRYQTLSNLNDLNGFEGYYRNHWLTKPQNYYDLTTNTPTESFDILTNNSEHIQLQEELTTIGSLTSTVTRTRWLESNMVVLTTANQDTLVTTVKHWGYLAFTDLYNTFIDVVDPRTKVKYNLSTRDAFIFIHYLSLKHRNLLPNKLPSFSFTGVINDKYKEPLRLNKVIKSDTLKVLPNYKPSLTKVISTYSFKTYVENYNLLKERSWLFVNQITDYLQKSYVDEYISRYYTNKVYEPNLTFDTWLTDASLPNIDYTDKEYSELIEAIITAATGYSFGQRYAMTSIQNRLLSLFKLLSSYTISVTSTCNTNPVIHINVAEASLGGTKELYELGDVQHDSVMLETAYRVSNTYLISDSNNCDTVSDYRQVLNSIDNTTYMFNTRSLPTIEYEEPNFLLTVKSLVESPVTQVNQNLPFIGNIILIDTFPPIL